MNRLARDFIFWTAGCVAAMAMLDGCAVRITPDDDDKPVQPGITAAAHKAMHEDYPAAIARVAIEVADKAGEFKSHGEVFDYTSKRTKEERDAAFKQVSDALDSELKPHENQYDAEKVRAAFRQVAEGYAK